MREDERAELDALAAEVRGFIETLDKMADKVSSQITSLQAELVIIRDDVAMMRSAHSAIAQQLRAHAESLVVLHGYHV